MILFSFHCTVTFFFLRVLLLLLLSRLEGICFHFFLPSLSPSPLLSFALILLTSHRFAGGPPIAIRWSHAHATRYLSSAAVRIAASASPPRLFSNGRGGGGWHGEASGRALPWQIYGRIDKCTRGVEKRVLTKAATNNFHSNWLLSASFLWGWSGELMYNCYIYGDLFESAPPPRGYQPAARYRDGRWVSNNGNRYLSISISIYIYIYFWDCDLEWRK